MALGITLDCNNLERQAAFWSAALSCERVDHDTVVELRPRAGSGPSLWLQAVPEPKTVKNRMHLDWDIDDMEREADRLVALGAQRGERMQRASIAWIRMHDPEGNEFCVLQRLG